MPQSDRAKKPKDRLTPTPAGQWKRAGIIEDLELPSGNVARVKRPGPAKLLTSGIMPDSLMPIVNAAIRSGKGMRPEDESAIANSPEKLAEVMDGVDRAMVQIIVQPPVTYHKNADGEEIPADDRDPEIIYTDEIDLDDKMFIFNFAVGGTRDLERFRAEQASHLGNVADDASGGGASE